MALKDEVQCGLSMLPRHDEGLVRAIGVRRLTASIEAMERRVQLRESGILQSEYVARVAKLNAILDRAHLEDFAVVNENRSLTDVALEMLVKAGWISK